MDDTFLIGKKKKKKRGRERERESWKRNRVETRDQCDQMARLLVQYLAIKTMKMCPLPSIKKIAKLVQNFAEH